MITEIVPCIMCLILGKVWCLLGFVPVIAEQNLWPNTLFGAAAFFSIVAAIVAWCAVANHVWSNGKICGLAFISAVSYFMLKLALFHKEEFLAPSILGAFIVVFVTIITFTVVHITLNMLWNFTDHWLRVFSVIAGMLFGMYDLGYGLTVNNYDIEYTFMVQGIIWVFFIGCLIGLYYMDKEAHDYEFKDI